jgi:DNA-binding HxlR family transcriptional regulator
VAEAGATYRGEMIDYGQFCTVARGAEVLCDRWTPLVVRELLCGSTRFNDIRRGVPRMSPTLLAKRLRTLEEFGVVRRTESGRHTSYQLTAAGEELRPIVMALGHWGARWIGSRLRPDQLDAGFLMWDVRRFVRLEEFPPDGRVVIHFHFRDAGPREQDWWLVVLTLEVRSTVQALTEVWTGDAAPPRTRGSADLQLVGPDRDVERFWPWLGRSAFAQTRASALQG